MPKTIGPFTLERTLGSGVTAKVKLAHDDKNNRVALKIFDLSNQCVTKSVQKLLNEEVNYVKNLDQLNIVRVFDFAENLQQVDSEKNKTKNVSCIALEYIKGGELFDYVAHKPFDEKLSKRFFLQMMHACFYMHSKGVVHRDLKPENILLDDKFNVKIADFGFAAPAQGRDDSGYLHTTLGTAGYMAPEIHEKRPYKGPEVDIFALGIILFILYCGHPPFKEAKQKDPYYRLIASNQTEMFWKMHSNTKPAGYFSDEFKELMTSMLAYNPVDRLSIADIIGHPWLTTGKAAATEDEVIAEFDQRRSEMNVEPIERNDDQQKNVNKRTRDTYKASANGKVYMNSLAEVPADEELKENKQFEVWNMAEYQPENQKTKNTFFFSDYQPYEIIDEFQRFFGQFNIEPKFKPEKGRIVFDMRTKLTEEEKEAGSSASFCQIQVDFMQVAGKKTIALDFKRKMGESWYFFEKFQDIRTHLSAIDIDPHTN